MKATDHNLLTAGQQSGIMMLMRTTLTLSDDLIRLARKRAAESHRTFKDIVNEALRLGLSSTGKPPGRGKPAFDLPVMKGKLMPGVNLHSNSDLLDLMDGL
jgi:hypothetical protein